MVKKRKKTGMPFSSKANPSRALTHAYLTAFGVIAVLTILTHILTTLIADRQQESMEISFKISQQYGQVQQVLVDGFKYYNGGSDIEQNLLQQTVKELSLNQYALVQAIRPDGGNVSDALYSVYFGQNYLLKNKIDEFIKTSEVLASYPPNDLQDNKKVVLRNLTQQSSSLLPFIDLALERYQYETLEVTTRNHYMQLAGVIMIIVVLLYEAVFIFRPLVAKINSYHKMLIKQAMEDPLTGLNNRRAFTKQATAMIHHAARKEQHICVVLCDLDHFKSVNDNYGHDVGDRVLKHFSALLKKSLRANDAIGRIGGEEFAIVLANDTNPESGLLVLERFCQTVANTSCPYTDDKGNEAELTYTTSIGFYSVEPTKKDNIHDLLKVADEALYEAKEKGRNRVVAVS